MDHKALLSLIKERLNELGPDEVIRQLYAAKTPGPSIEEFFNDPVEFFYGEKFSDNSICFYGEEYSVGFSQDIDCQVIISANDDDYFVSSDGSETYDVAA